MSTGPDIRLPDPAAPPPEERRAEIVRLLPVAVLVLSADRCFRAAATMLLSRRGCTVLAAAEEDAALAYAAQHAVDVLVVELLLPGGEQTSRAGVLAARIDAAATAAGRRVAPVGVVLVGELEQLGECADARAGALRPALDKWGPFERLYQAICDRDRARRLPPAAGHERWPASAPRPGAV